MCQLCQQLGWDLHKIGAIDADASGSSASDPMSWAALPSGRDGGSGPDWQQPGVDTVPGSPSTSFTISSGTSVRGYVNSAGEQDWYSVNLVAGQTYTFALSGFGTGALSDAYLRLFNASGTLIAEDDDGGPIRNSQLTFTASVSGTYYVSAGGWEATTGQYILTMNTGSTRYAPVVSVSDIATYLTNSYWEVNGATAHHWGVTSITYNVQALEPERAALARIAFQRWSEVANLTFVETTGAAQITFDDNQSGAFASSNWDGNGIITSAFVNVESAWFGGSDAIDSYTLQTFIHEIGHALGLGHAGPYNGSATYGIDNTYANDTWQLSLMSYMDQADYGSASYRFTLTPMMADILAIQTLYGAATTRTGDTVYGFGSTAGSYYNFSSYTQAPALTIYDSGGIDTLNASGYSQNQVINLAGGSFSNIGGLVGNIGIYTTSVIENAVGGSGNDTITGNGANNVLTGAGGNDVLDGGAGNDTLIGGAGNDTITTGSGDDIVVFSTGFLSDIVTDFVAGAGTVDRVDLRSMAGIFTFADVLAHATQSGANTVINFGGGDILTLQNVSVNSLNSGDFIFSGAPQPDLTASALSFNGATISYNINNVGTETVGASTTGIYLSADSAITVGDTLLITVAAPALAGGASDNESALLALPTNLNPGTYYLGVLADYNGQVSETDENNNTAAVAVILGNVSGNSLIGTSGNDTIITFDGDDVINGLAGADRMIGGTGNDTYYVDNLSDVVVENPGEGADVVYVTISGYTLPNNVEVGVLATGNGGTLIANNQGCILWSTSNNGTLIGGTGDDHFEGSAGADTMRGGAGNDVYVVNNLADNIVENPGEGATDIVFATISGYTLAANIEVGALLVPTGGTLTGNSGNNTLWGNIGNDTLVGGGGDDALIGWTGADAMTGGTGNDYYVVDNLNDVCTERPGEGYDTIYAEVSGYVMSANIEVGAMQLTTGGTLTGNAQDNQIWGNIGNDTLIGGAGNDTLYGQAGADVMMGGVGNDTYVVDNSGDAVVENSNEGADAVLTLIDYTLPANVEYLSSLATFGLRLEGNALNNFIYGNSGNDTLIGWAGNDVLSGGSGDDIFVFRTNDGRDTIIDFKMSGNQDRIDLTGVNSVHTFADVQSHAAQVGNDTVISFSASDSITLMGVQLSALQQQDFLLA